MMMFWVFLYGISLTLLGLSFYVGTGQESPTALIPALLGAVVLALGALCGIRRFRVHGMHAVTAWAAFGILGGAPGVVAILGFLAGGELARPYAALEQTLLVVLSSAFLLTSLRSFVLARRTRAIQ